MSSTSTAKPMIVVNDRYLRDLSEKAMAALVAATESPSVFVRDSLLTRLPMDEVIGSPPRPGFRFGKSCP